ncbi:MAG: alpha-glucoside transport system substrate-binding protein [Actinomycetota bacterium]|jgi:alpha-glucoside transport system substrate-binding protein
MTAKSRASERGPKRFAAIVAAVAVLIVSAAVAVRAGDAQTAGPERMADQPPLPPASIAAAKKAARAIVHGKKLGGSVDLLGVVTGAPGDALTAALKPFEDATGIKLNYEATFSQQSILQTRIQAGNPPDAVFSAYPLQLVQLARAGKLRPLNGVINMKAAGKQYPKPLLDLGTVKGKLYAYFSIVNYHAIIWYNASRYNGPRHPTWSQLSAWTSARAAQGNPPWCFGIESGAATGWPAANELLDALFVRRYGPKLAAAWERGKLAWSSPQVKWAWQTTGSILANSKMVNGGAAAVASTNFLAAGNGLFSSPPSCYLLSQAQWYGSYAPAAVQGATAANVGHFAFPSITPAYSRAQMVDGNQVALLRNRPQAKALVAYMATPQFETLLAESGQFLVPNSAVSHNRYPTPLSRQLAKQLVGSKATQAATILLPTVLFPVPVTNQFFKDLTSYLQNPSQLNSLLADMDSVVKRSK